MIISFRCDQTQALLAAGIVHADWTDFARIARRKLLMIDSARSLYDLIVPPDNRFEALAAERPGQHAIHIDGRFRVCFIWRDGDAYDVEIVKDG